MPQKLKKNSPVAFKCKQCLGYFSIKEKGSHDCELPTETSVLSELEQEPRQAWLKVRNFASSLGPQKIYYSAKAIMFSREVCYMFVRPGKKKLELFIMLDRKIKSPLIKKIDPYSKTRFRHTVHVDHEDIIEEPLTDWVQLAWEATSR